MCNSQQDLDSILEQRGGSESSLKLKSILEALKEYQRLLDHRNYLLVQASEYFSSLHSANIQLDQLETQLVNGSKASPLGHAIQSSDSSIALEHIIQQLEQIMMDILRQGKSILGQVGDRMEGMSGIGESMFHIENRANNLRANCHLKLSQVHLIYLTNYLLYVSAKLDVYFELYIYRYILNYIYRFQEV